MNANQIVPAIKPARETNIGRSWEVSIKPFINCFNEALFPEGKKTSREEDIDRKVKLKIIPTTINFLLIFLFFL